MKEIREKCVVSCWPPEMIGFKEYDWKMWTIYHQLFPEDNPDWNNLPWFPPQTEAYKDHPINVRLRKRREQLGC